MKATLCILVSMVAMLSLLGVCVVAKQHPASRERNGTAHDVTKDPFYLPELPMPCDESVFIPLGDFRCGGIRFYCFKLVPSADEDQILLQSRALARWMLPFEEIAYIFEDDVHFEEFKREKVQMAGLSESVEAWMRNSMYACISYQKDVSRPYWVLCELNCTAQAKLGPQGTSIRLTDSNL